MIIPAITRTASVTFLLLMFSSIQPVHSADVERLNIDQTNIDPVTWQRWGLDKTEWDKYTTYMEGEGKYHFEHLDPVFVMGILSTAEKDRKRYAELFATQEHSRNDRLIKFERQFRESFRELYGPLKPFSEDFMASAHGVPLNQASHPTSVKFGDRLTLFVNLGCQACSDAFDTAQDHRKNNAGTSIDIYFVGNDVTDEQIQLWAVENQIDPIDVADKVITLNHDDRYEHFGQPAIPSTWIVRGSSVVGEL